MNNQLKNLTNKKYRLEYINYNKIINAYSNHYLNQNINNVIVLKAKINKKKITEKQQEKRKNQIEKLQNQKNIKSIIEENILNQINDLIENLKNDFNLKIMNVRKEIRTIIKQYKESLRIKKLATKKKITDEQAKIIIIERNEKAKQKRLLKKQNLQNQNNQVAPIENIEILPIEKNEILPIKKIEILPIKQIEILPIEKIEILPIEIIEVVNIEKKKAIVQIKKNEVAKIEVEDEEDYDDNDNEFILKKKNMLTDEVKKLNNIFFYQNLESYSKRKTFFHSDESKKFPEAIKYMVDIEKFEKYFIKPLDIIIDLAHEVGFINLFEYEYKFLDILLKISKFDICLKHKINDFNNNNLTLIFRLKKFEFLFIGYVDNNSNKGYNSKEIKYLKTFKDFTFLSLMIKKLKKYTLSLKENFIIKMLLLNYKFKKGECNDMQKKNLFFKLLQFNRLFKQNEKKTVVKKQNEKKPAIIQENNIIENKKIDVVIQENNIIENKNIDVIVSENNIIENKNIDVIVSENKKKDVIDYKNIDGKIYKFVNGLQVKKINYGDEEEEKKEVLPIEKIEIVEEKKEFLPIEKIEIVEEEKKFFSKSIYMTNDIKNELNYYEKLRDDFYELIEFLQKNLKYGSSQQKKINDFLKKYSNIDFKTFFKDFCMNTQTLDFIYTEKNHIIEMLEKIKDNKEINNFLEPTCGLGHVIHEVLKINPKINITACELYRDYYNILNLLYPKSVYPNIEFINDNFLNIEINNKIDLIFCNPPFGYQTDKRYYINFLFKCFKILHINKNSLLYFISPKLYLNEEEDVEYNKIKDFLTVDKIKNIFNIELNKNEFTIFKNEKYEKYNDKINELNKLYDDIQPLSFFILKKIKFTLKANITVNIYYIEGFKDYTKNY